MIPQIKPTPWAAFVKEMATEADGAGYVCPACAVFCTYHCHSENGGQYTSICLYSSCIACGRRMNSCTLGTSAMPFKGYEQT